METNRLTFIAKRNSRNKELIFNWTKRFGAKGANYLWKQVSDKDARAKTAGAIKSFANEVSSYSRKTMEFVGDKYDKFQNVRAGFKEKAKERKIVAEARKREISIAKQETKDLMAQNETANKTASANAKVLDKQLA